MAEGIDLSSTLADIDGQLKDHFRALSNGFQKLDKIKDPNRQSKQLEELTGKMRECKRLIKEFDREFKEEESRNPPEINRQLNEKKQSMIKELNSYVALRKTYANSVGNKRGDLFEGGTGGGEAFAEENVIAASSNKSGFYFYPSIFLSPSVNFVMKIIVMGPYRYYMSTNKPKCWVLSHLGKALAKYFFCGKPCYVALNKFVAKPASL